MENYMQRNFYVGYSWISRGWNGDKEDAFGYNLGYIMEKLGIIWDKLHH